MSNASWFNKQQTYLQARAMALVQVKLRRRKIANAQLGFFKSSSKLLQIFVAPKRRIEEGEGEGREDRKGPCGT